MKNLTYFRKTGETGVDSHLAGGKKEARESLRGPSSSQFPPVLFLCPRFFNFADLTISEPGTGYKKNIFRLI